MTVAARDTTCGGIYRLTKPIGSGTYYTRCSRLDVQALVKRRQRRNRPTTEHLRELRDGCRALEGECVLMCHRTRFRSLDGKRHESVAYVGVAPDYQFREVKRAPGYGGNGD